jgi:hypothetical protein
MQYRFLDFAIKNASEIWSFVASDDGDLSFKVREPETFYFGHLA